MTGGIEGSRSCSSWQVLDLNTSKLSCVRRVKRCRPRDLLGKRAERSLTVLRGTGVARHQDPEPRVFVANGSRFAVRSSRKTNMVGQGASVRSLGPWREALSLPPWSCRHAWHHRVTGGSAMPYAGQCGAVLPLFHVKRRATADRERAVAGREHLVWT